MRVKDKSIIVTGCGGGIGEGIARRLAEEGVKVIVNDTPDPDPPRRPRGRFDALAGSGGRLRPPGADR